jgi:hypothetical protein
MKKIITTLLMIGLLTGCTTMFQGIVTVTEVVDSAMKNWAHLSNTGQTSKEFDQKVMAVHDRYRQAAAVAQLSLNTYKVTANQADFTAALTAARDGAGPLIDLIASILNPVDSVALKTKLMKAQTP